MSMYIVQRVGGSILVFFYNKKSKKSCIDSNVVILYRQYSIYSEVCRQYSVWTVLCIDSIVYRQYSV